VSVDLTIPAAVARAARLFGEAEALAAPEGIRLTYTQLYERVRTMARAFMAEGILPGERVALWAPNTHHWVLAGLGALSAGATLVPINTRFTGVEALDIIRRTSARALVVAGTFLGTDRLAELGAAAGDDPIGPETVIRIPVELHPSPPDLGVIDWSTIDELAASVPTRHAYSRAAAVRPGQVSDILFTSGTTGRSKGAMSTHRQSLGVAEAWAECCELTTSDRYLIVNPFFHSFGYKAGILACLVSGATLVPQAVYDVQRTMCLIDDEHITVLPGPPTIYQTMLDHPARTDYDLSTLRLAVTGATTVPTTLIERMQRELSFDVVLTGYGLTEAVVATMCQPGDDPQTVASTSGRAAAGFEVQIAGAEHPNTVGEILLRGPNLMLGYLDDPAATRLAIDQDGWLHTGDVGSLDDRGYLTITDRLGDMYICGGFNVYPAEVEQVLAQLEGIAESVVIGVSDARLGEVGKAFVVPRPGYDLSAEDVIAFCRTRLANYKVPRLVEFRADLPRNPTGKPLKRLLRAIEDRAVGAFPAPVSHRHGLGHMAESGLAEDGKADEEARLVGLTGDDNAASLHQGPDATPSALSSVVLKEES
jgi:acyl-CoA synthetase (AMP-forming)/AMP-acid ligase II